jgi:hypothetical protein
MELMGWVGDTMIPSGWLVSLASVQCVNFLRERPSPSDISSTFDLPLQLTILLLLRFYPLDTASSISKALESSMATSSESPSTANAIYSPLQDWNEIRLLYIQLGSGLDKIRCIIKHVKLPYKASNDFRNAKEYDSGGSVYELPPDELPYEALSYVWGLKRLSDQ